MGWDKYREYKQYYDEIASQHSDYNSDDVLQKMKEDYGISDEEIQHFKTDDEAQQATTSQTKGITLKTTRD